MVGDIERLIKKKLEIEPFELEDERPRRPPRRSRDDDEQRPVERTAERGFERRHAPVAADPLFDKPYEPSNTGTPIWEQARPVAPLPRMGLSPNIKAKRKVASLLGGGGA
jgi:hypothetical protein